jgi:hypothetical protein
VGPQGVGVLPGGVQKLEAGVKSNACFKETTTMPTAVGRDGHFPVET